MGLLDNLANALANGINKGADASKAALTTGTKKALHGNRYFPDADLEFRGYQDDGHVHIGLYPNMVRIGVRNLATRAFGEKDSPELVAAASFLGKGNRNISLRHIVDVERMNEGALTQVRLHVVGARNVAFKVLPHEAAQIESYILAHRY